MKPKDAEDLAKLAHLTFTSTTQINPGIKFEDLPKICQDAWRSVVLVIDQEINNIKAR